MMRRAVGGIDEPLEAGEGMVEGPAGTGEACGGDSWAPCGACGVLGGRDAKGPRGC